jgi:hypothetical protein
MLVDSQESFLASRQQRGLNLMLAFPADPPAMQLVSALTYILTCQPSPHAGLIFFYEIMLD